MPTVSIVIPTYMEEKYIVPTLEDLRNQDMWPSTELIIADYDPQGTKQTLGMITNYCSLDVRKKLVYVPVRKNGIGIARHVGSMAAKGRFIMAFDADARFNRTDAMSLLVAPLSQGFVMSVCGYGHNPVDLRHKAVAGSEWMPQLGNFLREHNLVTSAYEVPGITLSRDIYLEAGGFPDVAAGEGGRLQKNIVAKYGWSKIKFVKEVIVMVSGRRIIGKKTGIIMPADYEYAYR